MTEREAEYAECLKEERRLMNLLLPIRIRKAVLAMNITRDTFTRLTQEAELPLLSLGVDGVADKPKPPLITSPEVYRIVNNPNPPRSTIILKIPPTRKKTVKRKR